MRPRLPSLVLLALALATPAGGARGQDVEMLGRRYGTVPPASYYREIARDPEAFTFRRGRSRRMRLEAALAPGGAPPTGAAPLASGRGPLLALGPRTGPVVGTFHVPVLLGLYSNSGSTAPFTRDAIATAYFGGQTGSITDYYTEVSGGRATLVGDVYDWRQISQPDTIINDGRSGLFSDFVGGGGAGNFVYELLSLQVGVDWGAYDNDGPDGVPNSGDDDGFVDVVAVIHPTRGGECRGPGSGERIWSHRWSLSSAVFTTFVTGTPSRNGGFIEVDDYTIEPSVTCSGGGLNEIGVFTHELGHAFGLPDLYDTDGSDGTHAGAGIWDLMSSGSWGCDDGSPESPCHMGAWSKEQLGWADVVTLAPDVDHGVVTLPPVETTGTIYRLDANDGSGEYFLLENRQRLGYDQRLFGEGLLIWQVDPDWVAARWGANTVNGAPHMGVWLRQADGLDWLGSVSQPRGDAGDPFPGSTGNDAFHAATDPASTSYRGGPTGVTLVGITPTGDDVEVRLSTRYSTITVRADGAASPNGLFTVNGAPTDPPATTFTSAPFLRHTVEAIAGETVAPGERRPFVEWSDAPSEPRVRTLAVGLDDVELVAQYGGTQFALALSTSGAVDGVQPGSFVTTPPSPDAWFDQGTAVSVEAVPLTGFQFLGWSGAFAGQANPASATMTAPIAATADYQLVYAVATTDVSLTATVTQDLQLLTENGTAPYSWRVLTGPLPLGLSLSGTGRITGASLDVGRYPVTLEARDANGIPASATVTFDVGSPDIPIEALTSPFLLSGPPLSAVQLNFLNRQGNGVAGYDIGDFRAWLQAHPELPMSAVLSAGPEPRAVTLPLRFPGEEPRR